MKTAIVILSDPKNGCGQPYPSMHRRLFLLVQRIDRQAMRAIHEREGK
jgi:hypothetical protein